MLSNRVFNTPSLHPGKSEGPVVVVGKRNETITHRDSSSGTSTHLQCQFISCTLCLVPVRRKGSTALDTREKRCQRIIPRQFRQVCIFSVFNTLACAAREIGLNPKQHHMRREYSMKHNNYLPMNFDDVCVLTSNAESHQLEEKAVDNLTFGLGEDFSNHSLVMAHILQRKQGL